MSQPELVKEVARVLEDAGIAYLVTGSVASSLQGEPRSTEDVDFVAALQTSHVPVLIGKFREPAYYLSEEAVNDAIRLKSMFTIISLADGDKADVWLMKDDAFDRTVFTRRQAVEIFGARIMVTSPEDTILSKLRWAKLSGGSEKHYRDALRVYEVQQPELDDAYLAQWSKKLGVNEMLKRIRDEAGSVG